jgi:hypothetical protein
MQLVRSTFLLIASLAFTAFSTAAAEGPTSLKPSGQTTLRPGTMNQPTAQPTPSAHTVTPAGGGHPDTNVGNTKLGPTVTKISPTGVWAPHVGRGGDIVTIYGTRLKKSAFVWFGNDAAKVRALDAARDGSWLRAQVPFRRPHSPPGSTLRSSSSSVARA